MKKKLFSLWGTLAGFLNGMLGAGGGMVVVPILKTRLSEKQAHATSVAVILPICAVSALFYLQQGALSVYDALPYLLWGLLGSAIGVVLMKKLSGNMLRKIFALMMLWAGIRLIIR
ncbi:MAG: sulfite exporter TauE/SafE family protein [Ruminococcaceae bacterium]|nr:sulfite exporter TauE/SafE family protein [Oscillospiraceae bacterium]MBE5714268.1 sulfite exporter TauE/SafE family protein [Oscillospiraceae bacterium]